MSKMGVGRVGPRPSANERLRCFMTWVRLQASTGEMIDGKIILFVGGIAAGTARKCQSDSLSLPCRFLAHISLEREPGRAS